MRCPYCHSELLGNMTTPYCPNPNCKYWSFPMSSEIWQDLIDGKKAQSELNYYKGLNCPHVVEEQMQTITKLAKQLETAQRALKEATKCINWTIDTFEKGLEHETDIVGCCELSLERIDEITQQDTKE